MAKENRKPLGNMDSQDENMKQKIDEMKRLHKDDPEFWESWYYWTEKKRLERNERRRILWEKIGKVSLLVLGIIISLGLICLILGLIVAVFNPYSELDGYERVPALIGIVVSALVLRWVIVWVTRYWRKTFRNR